VSEHLHLSKEIVGKSSETTFKMNRLQTPPLPQQPTGIEPESQPTTQEVEEANVAAEALMTF